MTARLTLRTLALGYLALLLVFPVGIVFVRTFGEGLGSVWEAVTRRAARPLANFAGRGDRRRRQHGLRRYLRDSHRAA